jgi:putative ABC transport system permease protein
MAFSFMLLLGAGLLVSSFLRVARVDPGFETENMLFMDFDDNQMFYTNLERRQAFYDSLVRNLQATPGIQAAGMTDQVPLSDDVMTVAMPITLTQDAPLTSRNLNVFLRSVDSGFFQAMGIPVQRGRLFAGETT